MSASLYVKLDVNYFDDPKVTAVSTDAEVLFVRSLCYCKRLLSDGYIAFSQLPRIASDIGTDSDSESLAKELTSAGLWNDEPGGWRIAAWASHNDLAEEVEEKREAKRVGGVLGNHKRWHQGKKGTPSDDCPYCESPTDRSTDGPPNPLPSPETETETETEEGHGADEPRHLPDVDGMPLTPSGNLTYAQTLGKWAVENGVKMPDSERRADRYVAVLDAAMSHLDEEHPSRTGVAIGVVCDYLTDCADGPPHESLRGMVGRLVKDRRGYEGNVLRAVAEGVSRGAGLDPAREKDVRDIGKYATAILNGGKPKEAS